MRQVGIKAVVIMRGDEYFIHGSSNATPAQMFKTMMPLWDFDPSQETTHFVEVTILVPEFEKPPEIKVEEPEEERLVWPDIRGT